MEFLEGLFGRRSIRKFKAGSLSDEQIHTLLDAAMAAPSAGNAQPRHYVVVTERSRLDGISDWHPYAAMCREASLAVCVCGDPSLEKYPGYWVQDCAASVENLLLAAHGLGLGAVWLGVYPREDRVASAREYFQVPDSIFPMAVVAIGFPDEVKEPNHRFDTQRIHQNVW